MPKYCIACGNQLGPADAFCIMCGERVEQGAPAPASPAASPSEGSEFRQPAPPAQREKESDIAATEVWQVEAPVPVPSVVPVADVSSSTVSDSERKPCKHASHAGPEQAKHALTVEADGADGTGEADGSEAEGDEDKEDYSPTIVAQTFDEEDESPTIVVLKEMLLLVRHKNGERIELSLPCVVGRGSKSDRRIRGNQTISRTHARIYREGDAVMVADLGSTNGTHINGEELSSGGSAPLESGAVLGLGDEDFTFSIERL